MAPKSSKTKQPKASASSKNTNKPEASESSKSKNKLKAAESSVPVPSSVGSSTSKSSVTASSNIVVPGISVPAKALKPPPTSKPRINLPAPASNSVPSSRPLSVVDTQASASRQSSSSRPLPVVDSRVPTSHQASSSRPLSHVDLPAPTSSLPPSRTPTTKCPPSSRLGASSHLSSSTNHADGSYSKEITANKTTRSKPPGASKIPPEEAYQSLVYADMSKQQYVLSQAIKSPSKNSSAGTEVPTRSRPRPFIPYTVIGNSGMLLEWYSVKAMSVMMVDTVIRRFCKEVNWDWFEDNLSKFTKYERPLSHLEHYGGIAAVCQLWCREQDRASPMLFFDTKGGALRWGQQFVYLLIVRFLGDPMHLTREGQERIKKLAEDVANGGDIVDRTKLCCKANGLVYPAGTGRTQERLELIKRSLGSGYGKHVGVG